MFHVVSGIAGQLYIMSPIWSVSVSFTRIRVQLQRCWLWLGVKFGTEQVGRHTGAVEGSEDVLAVHLSCNLCHRWMHVRWTVYYFLC